MKKFQIFGWVTDKKNGQEYWQKMWNDNAKDGLYEAADLFEAIEKAVKDFVDCVNRENYDDWAEFVNEEIVVYGSNDYTVKNFRAKEA